MRCSILFLALQLAVATAFGQQVNLSGTVTSGTGGAPLQNVVVSLKELPGVKDTTGADGTYRLISSTAVISSLSARGSIDGCAIRDHFFEFRATGSGVVTIELFSVAGIKVRTFMKDQKVALGNYRLDLMPQALSSNCYLIRFSQDNRTAVYRYVPMSTNSGSAGLSDRTAITRLAKNTALPVDTLNFTLSGYLSVQVPVTGYTGKYDAVMQVAGTAPAGMRLISAGTYTMGAPVCGPNPFVGDGSNGCPIRQVQLSAFYIDTTGVTQTDYVALMGVNPSGYTGANQPVDAVTWFDAVLYCNARSKRDGRDTVYAYSGITGPAGNGVIAMANLTTTYTKNGYRLPTEAEREIACRAGTNTAYYWGDSMNTAYCWWGGTSDTPHPVAQKLPNAWGLYDMTGNLEEWTDSWCCGPWVDSLYVNPTGPTTGDAKFGAGGACNAQSPLFLRSAYNDDACYRKVNQNPGPFTGFRAVRPY